MYMTYRRQSLKVIYDMLLFFGLLDQICLNIAMTK